MPQNPTSLNEPISLFRKGLRYFKRHIHWTAPLSISICALLLQFLIFQWQSANTQTAMILSMRTELLKLVSDYKFKTAHAFLEHSLWDADENSREDKCRFVNAYNELVSEKDAVHGDPNNQGIPFNKCKTDEQKKAENKVNKLIPLLYTAYRKEASNQLIELMNSGANNEKIVVKALLNGIPYKELNKDGTEKSAHSYRANLYIAYTLARVKPGWHSTETQLTIMKNKLTELGSYKKDDTFKKRVDEAVNNNCINNKDCPAQ